jgi:arylsulfatase A-like enzyme
MADDMGWRDTGYHGNQIVKTPNLDSMASKGLQFDIYPTLLEITGTTMPNQPVLDGVSVVPLIDGQMKERPKPIGFMLWNQKGKKQENRKGLEGADFNQDTQGVWIDGKFKLVIGPRGEKVQLFDIYADQANRTNLAEKEPEVVARMTKALSEWRGSVRNGFDGKDYVSGK